MSLAWELRFIDFIKLDLIYIKYFVNNIITLQILMTSFQSGNSKKHNYRSFSRYYLNQSKRSTIWTQNPTLLQWTKTDQFRQERKNI